MCSVPPPTCVCVCVHCATYVKRPAHNNNLKKGLVIIRVRRMGGAAGSFSFYLRTFFVHFRLSVHTRIRAERKNEEKDARWIRGGRAKQKVLGDYVEE